MSEETKVPETKIDTTIADLDAKNEKINDLEAKLKTFEEAEAKKKADAEEAEAKSIQERLEAAEAKNKELAESFDKKLDEINMRQSTMSKTKEDKGLTKEEYEKNRVKYDTMYLKATLPDVYN